MKISAFLVKDRLLDWLVKREGLYKEQPNVVAMWTVGAIIREIEAGSFDWTSEGE